MIATKTQYSIWGILTLGLYNLDMKITALIPDDVLKDLQKYTKNKDISESILFALSDWLYSNKVKELNKKTAKHPFVFEPGFNAEKVRSETRRRRK